MRPTSTRTAQALIAIAAIAAIGAIAGASIAQPPSQTLPSLSPTVSPDYAESAALVAVSPDGKVELSMRIARFPGRGEGTLWLALFRGDERYGVVLEDVSLGSFRGRTPVEQPRVTFAVEGTAGARLECEARDTDRMRCHARVEALAHETLDPPVGAGSVPIRIDAEFLATHRGEPARGRVEVFGVVDATLTTPRGVTRLEAPGKWHEQTGERPRFAGAFTYLAIQRPGAALLARTGGGTTWGFAVLDGRTVAVETFEITPLGEPRRRFKAVLADGRAIEGETTVVRETSVPIEGQRRPRCSSTTSSCWVSSRAHCDNHCCCRSQGLARC